MAILRVVALLIGKTVTLTENAVHSFRNRQAGAGETACSTGPQEGLLRVATDVARAAHDESTGLQNQSKVSARHIHTFQGWKLGSFLCELTYHVDSSRAALATSVATRRSPSWGPVLQAVSPAPACLFLNECTAFSVRVTVVPTTVQPLLGWPRRAASALITSHKQMVSCTMQAKSKGVVMTSY